MWQVFFFLSCKGSAWINKMHLLKDAKCIDLSCAIWVYLLLLQKWICQKGIKLKMKMPIVETNSNASIFNYKINVLSLFFFLCLVYHKILLNNVHWWVLSFRYDKQKSCHHFTQKKKVIIGSKKSFITRKHLFDLCISLSGSLLLFLIKDKCLFFFR